MDGSFPHQNLDAALIAAGHGDPKRVPLAPGRTLGRKAIPEYNVG